MLLACKTKLVSRQPMLILATS